MSTNLPPSTALKVRDPIAIIKIRAVIIHNGKIFLWKLANPAGFYCLPGGTLEKNESARECLARELFEELGVHAKIWPLVYTQEMLRQNETKFDFWYWIENPEDFTDINLSLASHGFEHSEVEFYDPAELDMVRPSKLDLLLAEWNTHWPVFLQEKI
jgi:8-oxo-dGTP pyrophosphatase MutT (NUDIX family)